LIGATPATPLAATQHKEPAMKPMHWMRVGALLIAPVGWIIDLDHLLADPIYAPNRCSIGFHPLHTAPAIAVYAGLCVPKKTRLFGIGLMIHIVLDAIDCWWMRA